MRTATVAACAVLALAATGPVAHADPGVSVKTVSYAGPGCPVGSVAASLAADASNVNVAFDSLVAIAGEGIPIDENRKTCVTTITLQLPRNAMQFAVQQAEFRGYVDLDAKVTAQMKSTVYTPRTEPLDFLGVWEGALTEDFQVTDAADKSVYSINEGDTVSFELVTDVRADNSKNTKGQGFLANGTASKQTTVVLGLQWRG
jgi:hypothetical protein